MRTDPKLKQQYRTIVSYVGLVLLMSGILMCTPLVALIAWPEEWVYALSFILPAAVLSGIGMVLWRVVRPRVTIILTLKEGGVVVLISWIVVLLFSACPFMNIQGFSFTQAVFESVSGWTTTGLSVIDVSKAPHVLLLWRSIMQLAGGAGLVIIMLAAIAGPMGPGLSIAEGRSDQLVPHVRRSVELVLVIYTGYSLLGFVMYLFAGMSPFDSINHAFTAVSTGGFSTKPMSISEWDSAAIEAVSIPLMILGNLNFLTAYMLLNGKLKYVYRNGEIRFMVLLIVIAVPALFILLCANIYPSLGKSFRVALFETVSALTTTGFTSTVYTKWDDVGKGILILLMIIGGGTCSTAGGMKQYRIYLLCKSLLVELRRPFLPRTAVIEYYIWVGDRKDFISDVHIRQVALFISLYMLTFIMGTGIIAAHGFWIGDAMFEFASSLSTVGLSVSITSASSPPLLLWTETIGMFLGRLEFIVIIVSIRKIFRDMVSFLR